MVVCVKMLLYARIQPCMRIDLDFIENMGYLVGHMNDSVRYALLTRPYDRTTPDLMTLDRTAPEHLSSLY